MFRSLSNRADLNAVVFDAVGQRIFVGSAQGKFRHSQSSRQSAGRQAARDWEQGSEGLRRQRSLKPGSSLCRLAAGAEQLAVLFFDRFVALACALPQTFNVKDFYFAASVLDHSGFLKSPRHARHAGAPNAKHLSQKFLRERKLVAS